MNQSLKKSVEKTFLKPLLDEHFSLNQIHARYLCLQDSDRNPTRSSSLLVSY